MKLKADIIYIKSCKKEELIPTFAKVNSAIKSGGFKIKKKIEKLVMEAEIQDKQSHLRKIRKRYSIISNYPEINFWCGFV